MNVWKSIPKAQRGYRIAIRDKAIALLAEEEDLHPQNIADMFGLKVSYVKSILRTPASKALAKKRFQK